MVISVLVYIVITINQGAIEKSNNYIFEKKKECQSVCSKVIDEMNKDKFFVTNSTKIFYSSEKNTCLMGIERILFKASYSSRAVIDCFSGATLVGLTSEGVKRDSNSEDEYWKKYNELLRE